MTQEQERTDQERYDVVILGGGLAGQTLARQLALADPNRRLLIAERRRHPVPEAAFKVGESTVEIATHYFAEMLGLRDHLEAEQLPKLGLRFFLSHQGNHDITQRIEVGGSFFPEVPSFQLDRGRFENHLGIENRKLGIDFADGCSVSRVDFGQDGDDHRVELVEDGQRREVRGRWLVDASGRASILKHKLDLAEPVDHDAYSVWLRIEDRLDIDQWSDDPNWRNRVPGESRYLSTNHLMGRGYWVWLIPLASGATSVGIVADPKLHPITKLNRLPKALKWLAEHEPQCAAEIEKRRDQVLDFRSIRHFAHGCQRLYSGERWAITGEAGVFNDPFYSPGSDLIAMSNCFISDLVERELSGEDVSSRAEEYERILKNTYESSLLTYDGQYPAMGNARVTAAKLIWDNGTYWATIALLFFNDKLRDLDFMARVGPELWKFNLVNARIQKLFIEWDRKAESSEQGDFFLDFLGPRFMFDLQCQLEEPLEEAALEDRLVYNVRLCEVLATAIFRQAVHDLDLSLPEGDLNPYGLGLDPEHWQEEGLFDFTGEVGDPELAAELEVDLRSTWFETAISGLRHRAEATDSGWRAAS